MTSSFSRAFLGAFAFLAFLSAVTAAVPMVLIDRVSDRLAELQEDSAAAEEALSLALAVREHYEHQAQRAMHGGQHSTAHATWLQSLRERARRLEGALPPALRGHVQRLLLESEALDAAFREGHRGRGHSGDAQEGTGHEGSAHEASVHDASRARRGMEATRRATEAADALVAALGQRRADVQRRAQDDTRLAWLAGSIGVSVVIVFALVFGLRLRRELLGSLGEFRKVAERIGAGSWRGATGTHNRQELQDVAEALAAMGQQLEAREEALLRQERLLTVGSVAAEVAHELNNPIAVLRGYLKTMIPEATDADLEEELRILDEEAEACERIVADLRLAGRDPSLKFERVELAALLEQASERFLLRDFAGDLQVEAEPCAGDFDAQRLRQILDNLLGNAAIHGGDRILLRGKRDGASYLIEVEDDGQGIAPTDRDGVFRPFVGGRGEGSGLGLAVVHTLVQAHGGTVKVRDGALGGALFEVRLPLEPKR